MDSAQLRLLAIFSILLNAFAQLSLKSAMGSPGSEELSPTSSFVSSMLSPMFFCGMLCYALSIGGWMLVLKGMEVSKAYPLQSLGYVFVMVAGYLLFKEPLTAGKLTGIGVIVGGVIILFK
jgi:multidrug transporter EmrE-like cation transporter